MRLFDSLFGGYKFKANCPNCDCTFEAEVSDSQPIFYCPDCGYMEDWSTAPDALCSCFKDDTVRLYRTLKEVISETKKELKNVPSKVKFPNHLKNKIRYGTEESSLVFKGVMSEEERQELLELSQDETYKEAIRELFQDSQSNYSLETVENELEVLVFAMFVMKDRVIDEYYATTSTRQKRYKMVLSKFYKDLLHYAVHQIYLKGRRAKEGEANEFIYDFCNVLVPKRNTQYDESSRAYYQRLLKENLRDMYSGPIRTFLDNLGLDHGHVLSLYFVIMCYIAGVFQRLAALATRERE